MSKPTEAMGCDFCVDGQAAFIADNNASGIPYAYCEACEEHRAEKHGCALLLSEGAQCEDGICGCGGTGVL